VRKHRRNLRGREHNRQSLRPLGANDFIEPRQLNIEHMAIKKQQCRERLILG